MSTSALPDIDSRFKFVGRLLAIVLIRQQCIPFPLSIPVFQLLAGHAVTLRVSSCVFIAAKDPIVRQIILPTLFYQIFASYICALVSCCAIHVFSCEFAPQDIDPAVSRGLRFLLSCPDVSTLSLFFPDTVDPTRVEYAGTPVTNDNKCVTVVIRSRM